MNEVSFDEEKALTTQGSAVAPRREKGITGFLVSRGIARDAKTANTLLLSIAIISLVGAIAIAYATIAPENTPTQEQVRLTEWMKQGNLGAPPASFMPLR